MVHKKESALLMDHLSFQNQVKSMFADISNLYMNQFKLEEEFKRITIEKESDVSFTVCHPSYGRFLNISAEEVNVMDGDNIERQDGFVIKNLVVGDGDDEGQPFIQSQRVEMTIYCFSFIVLSMITAYSVKVGLINDKSRTDRISM